MSQNLLHKNIKELFLPGVLNSYSIIFFMNNRFLAVVLMLTTFLNFYAGLSGLLAVVFTLLIGKSLNLDQTSLKSGVYSFNALLTGIGMGTFFDPGVVYFSLLIVATILCLFISVALSGWLGKYNLPHLSIPFVISLWFILLPASHFENLGLTQRNIYWMNEIYAVGGNSLLRIFQSIDSMHIHKMLDIYLRSLSSIFFQSNLVAGILIAIALLISSRIFFSLSVIAFLSAYFFAQFTGSDTASLTYYNIGANYMMVAFAIGGFFIIPSKRSYLWTIILVPVTSLVLLSFYKLLGYVQLPVFSLPFSFVTILFIYFLQHRSKSGSLVLTPYQNYSPEINLYTYHNNKSRFERFYYKVLCLPFWGEWTVSQGYNGEYTHLGEWANAIDFLIKDQNNSTFRTKGDKCEDYYCYNKPVTAVANGIVESVIDNIADNEIGSVNTENNWGNTVIINHYNGIYSQLSHLKKGSVKVKPGDYVQTGDLLATCGNSGRSPEPHLHFQIQTLAAVGNKTIKYPISYYYKKHDNKTELQQFKIPEEGKTFSNINVNKLLHDSFNILPNAEIEFKYINSKGKEESVLWTSHTDAYNNKYLSCEQTGAIAYYVCDNFMFYFTTFYGNKNSLLYYFFISAYKIFFSTEEKTEITDNIPLNYIRINKFRIWMNDFVAPFYSFLKANYKSANFIPENKIEEKYIEINTQANLTLPGKNYSVIQSKIIVGENGIQQLNFNFGKIFIQATCIK
jgi:urea transporter/murein DD-endopeptidase MepM/ murein hydrolase activator NlpD